LKYIKLLLSSPPTVRRDGKKSICARQPTSGGSNGCECWDGSSVQDAILFRNGCPAPARHQPGRVDVGKERCLESKNFTESTTLRLSTLLKTGSNLSRAASLRPARTAVRTPAPCRRPRASRCRW